MHDILGRAPTLHRARHLLRDVERALLVQVVAHPPARPADDGPARHPGPGRERRRRRHRRRAGGRLQDGVAQPPVVHRAVPGRGDRRRRHPARRVHHGRAADRVPRLAALRPARSSEDARSSSRAWSRASPATATLRRAHRRRRGLLRRLATTATSWSTRWPSASRAPTRSSAARAERRRQSGALLRRQDRPRRHPRRDHGVGRVRRGVASRSARRCRSAIRSPRSCCSRRASSS